MLVEVEESAAVRGKVEDIREGREKLVHTQDSRTPNDDASGCSVFLSWWMRVGLGLAQSWR